MEFRQPHTCVVGAGSLAPPPRRCPSDPRIRKAPVGNLCRCTGNEETLHAARCAPRPNTEPGASR